jgi:UDP-2-acetamido-2,6-beta-L-arabino-hexul-4-ose reductase
LAPLGRTSLAEVIFLTSSAKTRIMPKVSIEVVCESKDHRGCVFEPLDSQFLGRQKNVHVAVTTGGAVRGNHFHRSGTEIAVVAGPAVVRLREDGLLRDCHVPEGEKHRFTIPAGVSHAFKNTGTASSILVAFNTEAFNPVHPDVVRDELF